MLSIRCHLGPYSSLQSRRSEDGLHRVPGADAGAAVQAAEPLLSKGFPMGP